MKRRFAGVFLLSFTILLGVWWVTDAAQRYRTAVLVTTHALSPIVNGWALDYDRPGLVDTIVYRSGDLQLPMLLQLTALSMGLMPFLSLVMATPGLGITRRAGVAVAGSVLYFLIDVAVVLAYPFLMDRPNPVKDTLGVFTALVAFGVAPLGLWFALTYPTLRSVWQLAPPAPHR